ncbi:MAG: hypothetical protein ACLP1D_04770 [Xanthobacteraceae bacterium]
MLFSQFRRGFIELSHEHEKDALRIVADGAIAYRGVGEGRQIPLVIIDTSSRPDLEEYIRLHQYFDAGDVKCQWGQLIGHDNTVALVLSFSRPAELVAIIEFDLQRNHGVLVECVLGSKALYIQAGREGDRLKHDVNLPKVILEVPDTGFGKNFWDKIYSQYTTAKMRERGLNRADAKRAAKESIKELRKLGTLRMGGCPPAPPQKI